MSMPNGNPTMHVSDGVDIRTHFDDILAEMNRRYEDKFKAMDCAVEKAENATEAWKTNANEWRGAMTDREKMFLPRTEYTIYHEGLAKQVRELERLKDIATGRASVATFVSIISVLIAIAMHFLK
jgi:hypothetical protein